MDNDSQNYDFNKKLMLKLRDNFNDGYNNVNNIDRAINTKNRLIISNNNENLLNDQKIKILLNIFFYTILILFVYFFISIKLLNPKQGLIISIIGLILFLINIFIKYIFGKTNFKQLSEATEKGFEKAIGQNLLNIDFSDYTCPDKCTVRPNNNNKKPKSKILQNDKRLRVMKTNSSRDIWKYGSLPDTLYTTFYDRNPYNQENQDIPITYRYTTEEENLPPRQWVRGLGDKSKKQIYYKCKWIGGPISDDMPMKKKYDNSTIPCNFLPGYKTEDIFIS